MSRSLTRLYYISGISIIIISLSIMSLIDNKIIKKTPDQLIRVVIPGESEISFLETGKYTIFQEYNLASNDKKPSTKKLSALHCALTSKFFKSAVNLVALRNELDDSRKGHKRRSLYKFNIKKTGSYRFSANYKTNHNNRMSTLAIGRVHPSKMIKADNWLMTFFIFPISFGLFLMIYTFFTNQQKKKKNDDTVEAIDELDLKDDCPNLVTSYVKIH